MYQKDYTMRGYFNGVVRENSISWAIFKNVHVYFYYLFYFLTQLFIKLYSSYFSIELLISDFVLFSIIPVFVETLTINFN